MGVFIVKNIKYVFFCVLLGVFTGCSNKVSLSSVDFEACFMNYKEISEIQNTLEQLDNTFKVQPETTTDKQITFLKPIIGCLNYQLGRYKEAEQWLLEGIETKDPEINSMASSALGLIYLKQLEIQKIEPLIPSAKNYYLGRWMVVLYYLELYRNTHDKIYLQKSLIQLEDKHKIEGTTTATNRLLAHIKIIYSMELSCVNKGNAKCSLDNLLDEKIYLFSTAYGFLSMLLKQPPLNNIDSM